MINDLNIKIFYDGVNIDFAKKYENIIDGITTNPSLMRSAGIENYIEHSQLLISRFPNIPISFEVISDDFDQMKKEARTLSDLGENVFVKIPICNSKGESSFRLIQDLVFEEIPLNITAIFSGDQVAAIEPILDPDIPAIFSIFAGRIADAGKDPVPIVEECSWLLERNENAQLLWASTRELFNIFQANDAECTIITIPESIFSKLDLIGKNLENYSRETVEQFHLDALAADYRL